MVDFQLSFESGLVRHERLFCQVLHFKVALEAGRVSVDTTLTTFNQFSHRGLLDAIDIELMGNWHQS